MLRRVIVIKYRVAPTVALFSIHRIFGTVQDKMKQISPDVPKVSGNKD